MTAAVAFFGGAVYEAAAVVWVRFAERRAPARAALCSAVCAACLLAGVESSIREPGAAPWFVLGYAVGTYCAVRLRP